MTKNQAPRESSSPTQFVVRDLALRVLAIFGLVWLTVMIAVFVQREAARQVIMGIAGLGLVLPVLIRTARSMTVADRVIEVSYPLGVRRRRYASTDMTALTVHGRLEDLTRSPLWRTRPKVIVEFKDGFRFRPTPSRIGGRCAGSMGASESDPDQPSVRSSESRR